MASKKLRELTDHNHGDGDDEGKSVCTARITASTVSFCEVEERRNQTILADRLKGTLSSLTIRPSHMGLHLT